MIFTKWTLMEIVLLLSFAAALYLLYSVMTTANSIAYNIENEFKPAVLQGAISFALAEPGKPITTKDFNFGGPAAITSFGILKGSELNLPPEKLCFALSGETVLV